MTDAKNDKVTHVKAYLRTPKGKAAKRKAQDSYRARNAKAIAEYESTEARKAAKNENVRQRRARSNGWKTLCVLLRLGCGFDGSNREFLARWLLTLCRDRRKSVAVHRLSEIARRDFLPRAAQAAALPPVAVKPIEEGQQDHRPTQQRLGIVALVQKSYLNQETPGNFAVEFSLKKEPVICS
jgi:hypothetical protein